MTKQEAEKIENKLYNEALSRYLDKTDWDISEWMSDDDWEIYQEARNIVFGY